MQIVDTILEIAANFERAAKHLRELAQNIDETKDIDRADEAGSIISNCIASIRIDMLMRRVLRDDRKNNK